MDGTGPPPMKSDRSYVNPKEDDQMEIYGLRPHRQKIAIVSFFIVCTVGLLRLFFYWLPHLHVKATHSRCSLSAAKTVLLKNQWKQWYTSRVLVDNIGDQIIQINPTFVNGYKTAEEFCHPAPEASTPVVTFPVESVFEEESVTEGTVSRSLGHVHLVMSGVPHLAITQTGFMQNRLYGYAAIFLNQDGPSASWFIIEGHMTGVEIPFPSHNSVIRFAIIRRTSYELRYFICKKIKYIWDTQRKEFTRLRLYGTNSMLIHVTPIIKILFKEVLSPFYVFQVFSVCLFYSDQYEVYASVIVFISMLSIIITVYQTRKMQRALRSTISSTTTVSVCRENGEYHDITSEELVPGDVIEIPRHGCMMQCDAVLISGNCIVNESMLTGESVPVTKTPLPNPMQSTEQQQMFDIRNHSRHVLFCGTHVIQTRFYGGQKVNAVVVRTGFMTAKGELVRSILYPKPVDFKFNRDIYHFIAIMSCLAVMGFIFTVVLMVRNGDPAGFIILRALTLVTVAVQPALPAALTIGIIYAQQRLKEKDIFCISPRGINVCGAINTVCFDKTGTLTEDGLNMMCVVSCSEGRFDREVRDVMKLPNDYIITAMATCHSLTIIEGQIIGDPLDLIMFEATEWNLEEPGKEETRFDMIVPTVVSPNTTGNKQKNEDVAIVKQFPFASALQRMSVVTRKLGAANFDLFVKGAPEMITSLSRPETVPSDFHEVLMGYTEHGYRVIALAWKPLPQELNYEKVKRLTRDQVEKELTFLGLLVMENCLKPETTPTIQVLKEADIRNIMVTGDNMLTALSVARECGIVDHSDRIILVQAYPPQGSTTQPELEFIDIDYRHRKTGMDGIHLQLDHSGKFHLAVTGKSWAVIRQHFPEVLRKVMVKGTIFARMGPEQKAQLVENLQLLGYYVGMCGDGANDCGALKTAHTGISLSEAEASVASPFTSKKPTIECVPTVIREGRAALVTSFGIFKFMACYSLILFETVLFLYWYGANFTNFEYLSIDLFIVLPLGVTFGRTHAYPELTKDRPPFSLLAVLPILSIMVQMFIHVAFQVFCYFHIVNQPWFVPFINNPEEDYTSFENAAIFRISSYQYIIAAVTFSKGAPFRKTMFSNNWFLLNVVLSTALCIWISVYPTQGFADFLGASIILLKSFPSPAYGLLYVGLAFMNFIVSVMVEMFLIDNESVKKKCYSILEAFLSSSQHEYEVIEQEIADNPTWPPVTSRTDLAAVFQRQDNAHIRP